MLTLSHQPLCRTWKAQDRGSAADVSHTPVIATNQQPATVSSTVYMTESTSWRLEWRSPSSWATWGGEIGGGFRCDIWQHLTSCDVLYRCIVALGGWIKFWFINRNPNFVSPHLPKKFAKGSLPPKNSLKTSSGFRNVKPPPPKWSKCPPARQDNPRECQ